MDAVRNQMKLVQTPSVAERGANDVALPAAARSFAILTCMDARIDGGKLAALRDGDAQIVRNAGARASDDAIRSLMLSYTAFGTREWFVVHHSHCGLALLDEETSRDLLIASSNASLRDSCERVKQAGAQGPVVIDWSSLHDECHGLVEDVDRIRNHPLVPQDVSIYGYIYQTDTGRLVRVQQATRLGS